MTDFTKFYGFSENPFAVAPDPQFFFPSESHGEALASLLYGINHKKGFVLILGEAGSGKTTLIHHLINTLEAKVKTIFFPQSQIPFEQMLKDMLLKLELPLGLESKGSMMHELYDHLIGCLEREETVAVIIDEAENIGLKVIEEVRLLANLETSTSKLLQIVLVGQPELREKLRSEVIRQIKQRIVISCEIKPLSEEESLRYIDHRMKIVGSGCNEVFTDVALDLICRYAKGVPLTLNILCSNALSVGCCLAEKRISPSTVQKVRGEKGILTMEQAGIIASRMKKRLGRKTSFIMSALAILSILLFFGWHYVQPILDTKKPKLSVPSPAVRDHGKAPSPEVETHAVDEDVPVSPVAKIMDALPETPRIPASPPAAIGQAPTEIRVKELVEVKEGANLYSLAYKYYKEDNETFLDHILKINPEITNPNLIQIHQKIKIPEITDSLLIIRSPDGPYKVHLKTFANLKRAEQYKSSVSLKGKEMEIIPWRVSRGETWYRVLAGPFVKRDEALKALEEVKLR